ncbi:hypothetical protein BESB_002290 [Besnoitia besnoiti]|uniref:Crossover junction endonuclease MUS81 n=1 Tax=Besnoitia besnoiti TaxID=94643 RepID=A0A2A9MH78_BESBE|nr:hypothetical protein BESB_002290 [Besnoitia besnoiti]PFH37888.1 hypothetical protein BESB_002290 [Besnoitia besnoiti]
MEGVEVLETPASSAGRGARSNEWRGEPTERSAALERLRVKVHPANRRFFDVLLEARRRTTSERQFQTYSRGLRALQLYPLPITTREEAEQIDGVGGFLSGLIFRVLRNAPLTAPGPLPPPAGGIEPEPASVPPPAVASVSSSSRSNESAEARDKCQHGAAGRRSTGAAGDRTASECDRVALSQQSASGSLQEYLKRQWRLAERLAVFLLSRRRKPLSKESRHPEGPGDRQSGHVQRGGTSCETGGNTSSEHDLAGDCSPVAATATSKQSADRRSNRNDLPMKCFRKGASAWTGLVCLYRLGAFGEKGVNRVQLKEAQEELSTLYPCRVASWSILETLQRQQLVAIRAPDPSVARAASARFSRQLKSAAEASASLTAACAMRLSSHDGEEAVHQHFNREGVDRADTRSGNEASSSVSSLARASDGTKADGVELPKGSAGRRRRESSRREQILRQKQERAAETEHGRLLKRHCRDHLELVSLTKEGEVWARRLAATVPELHSASASLQQPTGCAAAPQAEFEKECLSGGLPSDSQQSDCGCLSNDEGYIDGSNTGETLSDAFVDTCERVELRNAHDSDEDWSSSLEELDAKTLGSSRAETESEREATLSRRSRQRRSTRALSLGVARSADCRGEAPVVVLDDEEEEDKLQEVSLLTPVSGGARTWRQPSDSPAMCRRGRDPSNEAFHMSPIRVATHAAAGGTPRRNKRSVILSDLPVALPSAAGSLYVPENTPQRATAGLSSSANASGAPGRPGGAGVGSKVDELPQGWQPMGHAFQVCLVLDNRERVEHGAGWGGRSSRAEFLSGQLRRNGVLVELRPLPVGDALWVVQRLQTGPELGGAAQRLPQPGDVESSRQVDAGPREGQGFGADAVASAADHAASPLKKGGAAGEFVLPIIVERKTLRDLSTSIRDGRYEDQKYRLMHCSGVRRVLYLVEGLLEASPCPAVPLAAAGFAGQPRSFAGHLPSPPRLPGASRGGAGASGALSAAAGGRSFLGGPLSTSAATVAAEIAAVRTAQLKTQLVNGFSLLSTTCPAHTVAMLTRIHRRLARQFSSWAVAPVETGDQSVEGVSGGLAAFSVPCPSAPTQHAGQRGTLHHSESPPAGAGRSQTASSGAAGDAVTRLFLREGKSQATRPDFGGPGSLFSASPWGASEQEALIELLSWGQWLERNRQAAKSTVKEVFCRQLSVLPFLGKRGAAYIAQACGRPAAFARLLQQHPDDRRLRAALAVAAYSADHGAKGKEAPAGQGAAIPDEHRDASLQTPDRGRKRPLNGDPQREHEGAALETRTGEELPNSEKRRHLEAPQRARREGTQSVAPGSAASPRQQTISSKAIALCRLLYQPDVPSSVIEAVQPLAAATTENLAGKRWAACEATPPRQR